MTNISKFPLEHSQLEQLFKQLSKHLSLLNTSEVNFFLTDLLGNEERIMLAKRLAAIVMLIQGQTIYKTSISLHLSTSTVTGIEKKLHSGEYTHIVSKFKKDTEGFIVLLETLDSILHLGGILPHYNGLERYKGLR